MAKLVAYQVTSTTPVCVEYPDGRVISFRHGMQFEAHTTNASVRRLFKIKSIRRLGSTEQLTPLPVKLGASHRVKNVIAAQKNAAAMRNTALKNTNEGSAALGVVDLGALNKPTNIPKPPRI